MIKLMANDRQHKTSYSRLISTMALSLLIYCRVIVDLSCLVSRMFATTSNDRAAIMTGGLDFSKCVLQGGLAKVRSTYIFAGNNYFDNI